MGEGVAKFLKFHVFFYWVAASRAGELCSPAVRFAGEQSSPARDFRHIHRFLLE